MNIKMDVSALFGENAREDASFYQAIRSYNYRFPGLYGSGLDSITPRKRLYDGLKALYHVSAITTRRKAGGDT